MEDPTPGADPNAVTVHRDVAFHETPERTLALDVYEPDESGPRPTILFVHGDDFVSGDKGAFARHALEFADRGYVAVESQYRLGDEASFPAALVDVKAALEWLRSESDVYGVDPRRIAVAGQGAGATLAALAAETAGDPAFEPDGFPGVSSAVGAAVGYAGIYDLATWDGPGADPYLEAPGVDRREVVDLASPLGQSTVETPPTLLVHGRDDARVPADQSRRYHDALATVTDAELELLTGEGADAHFPCRGPAYELTVERTAAFLADRL